MLKAVFPSFHQQKHYPFGTLLVIEFTFIMNSGLDFGLGWVEREERKAHTV